VSEACVRLTPAGLRGVYLRDDDEVALAIAFYMQESGRPFYLDQIESVPREAWCWIQDRRNAVLVDGAINPELRDLLAEWNPA
jgi:hypothetical protein